MAARTFENVERFERRPKKFAFFVARRRFVRRLRSLRDEIERRRIDGAAGRSGPALPRELVFFASVGRERSRSISVKSVL